MKKIKEWWYAEREDRIEKGTEQDMCPTNGDTVVMFVIMTIVSLCIAGAILSRA